jgi:hypothetical protein
MLWRRILPACLLSRALGQDGQDSLSVLFDPPVAKGLSEESLTKRQGTRWSD